MENQELGQIIIDGLVRLGSLGAVATVLVSTVKGLANAAAERGTRRIVKAINDLQKAIADADTPEAEALLRDALMREQGLLHASLKLKTTRPYGSRFREIFAASVVAVGPTALILAIVIAVAAQAELGLMWSVAFPSALAVVVAVALLIIVQRVTERVDFERDADRYAQGLKARDSHERQLPGKRRWGRRFR